MSSLTKDQLVAVLNDAGVTDPQKQRLHAALEQRHPQLHQALLEWLGLPAAAIQQIRAKSQK
jgi:hypothetical protein